MSEGLGILVSLVVYMRSGGKVIGGGLLIIVSICIDGAECCVRFISKSCMDMSFAI